MTGAVRTALGIVGALALAALMVLPGAAHARCIGGGWVSASKAGHAAGSAAIVFATNAAVRQFTPTAFAAAPEMGVWPGIVAGAVREVDKATLGHGYSCEWSSMAYDALGIALGVTATHWLLIPAPRGATVAYSREF